MWMVEPAMDFILFLDQSQLPLVSDLQDVYLWDWEICTILRAYSLQVEMWTANTTSPKEPVPSCFYVNIWN
jgi:hypothetical protein